MTRSTERGKIMKRQITRRTLMISFLCVVLLTGPHTQAQTEQTRQVTMIQDMGCVGLIYGQTLSYTRANLNDPDPQKRLFEPMLIQVRLLAADGSVIAQDGAVAVGVGMSQSFDFTRDQIMLPGEVGTARLQVRLEVTVIGQSKWPNLILKQGILETFSDMTEVIDNSSGQTIVRGRGANELILNDSSGTEKLNRSFQITSAGSEDYLVGIVPGQRLRITVLYTNFPDQSGELPQFNAIVSIFMADGRQIAKSEEIEIPAGGFHSFDFDATDLRLSGEPGTGRLQVRIEIHRRFFPGIVARLGQGASAVELVDSTTGKTIQYVNPGSFQIISAGRD